MYKWLFLFTEICPSPPVLCATLPRCKAQQARQTWRSRVHERPRKGRSRGKFRSIAMGSPGDWWKCRVILGNFLRWERFNGIPSSTCSKDISEIYIYIYIWGAPCTTKRGEKARLAKWWFHLGWTTTVPPKSGATLSPNNECIRPSRSFFMDAHQPQRLKSQRLKSQQCKQFAPARLRHPKRKRSSSNQPFLGASC